MKKFPITYWCGPPVLEATEERYRQIAEAGFTHASPPYDPDLPLLNATNNRKVLDLCKQFELPLNVSDFRMVELLAGRADLDATLDALVADYGRHPALESYYVIDEPGADKFELLGKIRDGLHARDPQHFAYINLFPNYATPAQLQTSSYEEHLDRYLEQVRPAMLSYDHYHFFKGEGEKDRPGWFDNLEIARRKALEHNIPLLVIVLVVEHGSYRNLTEAEIRWEVFQALAYGAGRLSYFTYWTPFQCDDAYWKWKNGMVSVEGELTEHYYQVQRINRDLQALGSRLVGQRSLAVYHSGSETESVTPFRSHGALQSIAGGRVTLGFFEGGWLLVVNKEWDRPTTVNLGFAPGTRLWRVETAGGREEAVDLGAGPYSVSLTLEAGAAELLRFDA